MSKLIIIILAICLIVYVFLYYENNSLQVTDIDDKFDGEKSINIVHLSDLHGKQFGRENVKLFKKIKDINPDFIVITGDLIDMNGKKINETIKFLGRLKNIAPVYYVLGNHEHRLNNLEELKEKVKSSGVKLLTNEIDEVYIEDKKVNILGLDENQASFEDYKKRKAGKYEYKEYKDLFKELEGKDGIKIVLSHYPENFALIGDKSYNKYNFNLMFSGHAHGGQFILPFIGGVFAPGQGLFPKYYSGAYGEKPKLVVSRGLGRSRFPFRLFNRPEIVNVKIKYD